MSKKRSQLVSIEKANTQLALSSSECLYGDTKYNSNYINPFIYFNKFLKENKD